MNPSTFPHLSFRAPLAAISLLAASALAVQGATEEVTIKLGGKKFSHGKTLTIGSPTKTIQPSESYDYEISGTVRGKNGILGKAFPKEVPLDKFLDGIKKGTSSILSGSVANPGGTVPASLLSTRFSGSKRFKGVGRLALKLKLTLDIAADGQVTLQASQIRIRAGKKKATGFMRFGRSSQLVASTAPVLEFKRTSQNIEEGTASIEVTVWKQGNKGKPASIDFATSDDSAIAGEDYVATSGTLTFAANETEKTISIPILDDAVIERFERFKITLSNPAAGTSLGARTEMTIGVFDND